MRKIGFSHSVLFKVHDVYTNENIQLFIDCGCTAIEVNFHHANQASLLENITESVRGFKYISIHSPVDIRYGNNPDTRSILRKIEELYLKLNAKLIVVHPDLVDDWEVFNDYKVNWAIENMDDRKEHFKDALDLKEFFISNPFWGLVLDVGHCNSNDKSMILAHDLITEFKDRIREIHLSGYKIFHEPLNQTGQVEIINSCKQIDVPIIIESTFEKSDGIEGAKKEFDYIIEKLK